MVKTVKIRKLIKKKTVKNIIYRIIFNNSELSILLLITLISAVIRVYFSLKTWGMIQSDEVFQSLEIAHKLVYGYGTIYPEFQQENLLFPSYAQCRSYMFPLVFTIPMYIGKLFSWNYWAVTIPFIRVLLGINGALLTPSTYCLVKQYSRNKKYAIIVALVVTLSPFLIFMSFRSLTNIFLVPWIFFIIASFWKKQETLVNNSNKINEHSYKILFLKFKDKKTFKAYIKITFLSVLLGLMIYIRLDIIIGIIAIMLLKFPYRKKSVIIAGGIGLFTATIIGGLVDLVFYGKFLVSPVNWVKFNILEGNASKMFGEQPFSYYFQLLASYDFVLLIIVLCMFTLSIICVYAILSHKKNNIKKNSVLRILGGFQLATFFVILIFSFAKHKEIRFIYFSFIYLHISFALTLIIIAERAIPKISEYSYTLCSKLKLLKTHLNPKGIKVLYISILIIGFCSGSVLVSIQETESLVWMEADEIARGLAYVGQLEDSTGVIVLIRWFRGDMYTYLHKNIPLKEFKDLGVYLEMEELVLFLEENNQTYNYIILPSYQIEATPTVVEILSLYGYKTVHKIENRCQIYSN